MAETTAAAFFDLDRTLISGSSAYYFGIAAWHNDMIPLTDLLSDARKAVSFKLFGATDERSESVRDRILAAVEGARQEDLLALNEETIPQILDKIRPESRSLIDMHHEAGRDCWIVSASPIEMVDPLARALGMEGGIGTRSAVLDGRYTGQLDGPFVYGEGKAEAIQQLARQRGYQLPLCYAYSDSASDLPMMEMVGHPVAVNPDGPLENVANQRGWPIVVFAQRIKNVVKTTTAIGGAIGLASTTYALGRRHGRITTQAARSVLLPLAVSGPSTPRFQRSPHLVELIAEVERLATLLATAPGDLRAELGAGRQLDAARASLVLDGARMETITDAPTAAATVAASAFDIDAGELATSAASRATWLDTLRVLDDPEDAVVGALELLGVLAADDSDDVAGQILTDADGALSTLHRRLTRGLVAADRAGALREVEQAVHDGATGRIIYLPTAPAALAREFGLLTVWLTSAGAREHGVIASGVVHLELLRLHPFDAANGRLARAAARAVLRARGLDPDHLAVPETALAGDPLGYHEEVAHTLRRRDLTIWLERWAGAVADGLRDAARTLGVLHATPPARALRFVADHQRFTIADYRAEAAAEPEEVRAELTALLDAGRVQRLAGSRGLRFLRCEDTDQA